jgi:DnaJ homolog subfamily C member 28
MSVEDEIRRAIEQGKFSNLKGKGKPLHLDDNPMEDPSWRSAYHVLHNDGFTLPWIQERQEIDAALEKARKQLAKAWHRRLASMGREPASRKAWEQAIEVFRVQVGEMNKKILSYNLNCPSSQLQRAAIHVDREVEALTNPRSPSTGAEKS